MALVQRDCHNVFIPDYRVNQRQCLSVVYGVAVALNRSQSMYLRHRGSTICVSPQDREADIVKRYNVPDRALV